jgi:hypothetical protein
MNDVFSIFREKSVKLSDTDGTSRALSFQIGDVVIKSLCRLTTGIVACLHKDIGDLCLVECTVSDSEGRLE